jgi:hypothetical protein
MRPYFITFLLILSSVMAYSQAQTNTIQEEAAKQKAEPFFIQVVESTNPREYFPKLYPIGFILKETNKDKKKTKYLLGDFSTEVEARDALNQVKGAGYKDAFIVSLN